VERELIPVAKDQGLTVLAWSPLRSGLLTGKYLPENEGTAEHKEARLNTEMMKGFALVDEPGRRTVREVVNLAKEMEVTPVQVALAWLRHRPIPVIPIIGVRKLAQLDDNLKSLETTFSPEQLHRLNVASAVQMGFPHDFLASDMVRTFTFGGMRDRLKA
jgi:aryl-alcohol dehydrogenase-like predicted oxidoreductase